MVKDRRDKDASAALEGPCWFDIWGIHSTYGQLYIWPDMEVTDKRHLSSFLGSSQKATKAKSGMENVA